MGTPRPVAPANVQALVHRQRELPLSSSQSEGEPALGWLARAVVS